jgi:hypothetical protein
MKSLTYQPSRSDKLLIAHFRWNENDEGKPSSYGGRFGKNPSKSLSSGFFSGNGKLFLSCEQALQKLSYLGGHPQEVTAINFFQDPCRIAFSPETEGVLMKEDDEMTEEVLAEGFLLG